MHRQLVLGLFGSHVDKNATNKCFKEYRGMEGRDLLERSHANVHARSKLNLVYLVYYLWDGNKALLSFMKNTRVRFGYPTSMRKHVVNGRMQSLK